MVEKSGLDTMQLAALLPNAWKGLGELQKAAHGGSTAQDALAAWLWGWLDAKGAQGYTAQVSFHADRASLALAPGQAETFRWTDAGGDAVRVELRAGRVSAWQLERASAPYYRLTQSTEVLMSVSTDSGATWRRTTLPKPAGMQRSIFVWPVVGDPAGLLGTPDPPPVRNIRPLVDRLFFWQPEHCARSYDAERARYHLPPLLRGNP